MIFYVSKFSDGKVEVVCDYCKEYAPNIISELAIQDVVSHLDSEYTSPYRPICAYCGDEKELDNLPQRLEVGGQAFWWEEPVDYGPRTSEVVSGKITRILENGDVMVEDEIHDYGSERLIKQKWLAGPKGDL